MYKCFRTFTVNWPLMQCKTKKRRQMRGLRTSIVQKCRTREKAREHEFRGQELDLYPRAGYIHAARSAAEHQGYIISLMRWADAVCSFSQNGQRTWTFEHFPVGEIFLDVPSKFFLGPWMGRREEPIDARSMGSCAVQRLLLWTATIDIFFPLGDTPDTSSMADGELSSSKMHHSFKSFGNR